MKTQFVFATMFVLLAALASVAASAMSSKTEDFITKASVANQFEISSSQLALKDSNNDQVRQFAQQMIDDHKQIGDHMTAALATASLQPPAAKLDTKHQKMLDKLTRTPPAKFDRTYIDMQVKGHNQAAKLFADYAQNGDDAALKDFAVTNLPTIQQHLQHAEALKAAE